MNQRPHRPALRVGLVQMRPRKARVDQNLETVRRRIAEHGPGHDLLVFPEACLSGYFLEGGVVEAEESEMLHAVFDFGTLLYTGFNSLRLGMSISNMGPEMKFSGDDLAVPFDELQGTGNNSSLPAELKTSEYDLPMTFRFGVAYDFLIGTNAILTTAAELKHPNDNLQQGALGAELAISEQFFLRSGYKLNYEEEGLALGGGLLTTVSGNTKLAVDYAWQDFGRLESTQRFSIGFRF